MEARCQDRRVGRIEPPPSNQGESFVRRLRFRHCEGAKPRSNPDEAAAITPGLDRFIASLSRDDDEWPRSRRRRPDAALGIHDFVRQPDPAPRRNQKAGKLPSPAL